MVGGGGDYSDAQLSATVKDQLRAWWGEQVDSWDLLRIYRYVQRKGGEYRMISRQQPLSHIKRFYYS
jgi:hypothetical protein